MMKILFLACLLASPALADDKAPEHIPPELAQHLDYLHYRISKIMQSLFAKHQKEFDKEVAEKTKDLKKEIEDAEKKYNFKYLDDKGQEIDTVDIDTGKITRKAAKPKAQAQAEKR